MIYLVTFLVNDESHAASVKQAIESVGGRVVMQRGLGKRKLAYPINQTSEAFYFTYQFEGPTDAVDKLDKKLRLNEHLLRFLIVRTEQIVKFERPQLEPARAVAPAPMPEPKPAPAPVVKPKKVVKKPEPIKKDDVAESERLKKLEEKLQELLKE